MTSAQFDRITVDPQVLGGKPCIRSLRITVGMVVQMVAALAENEYHLVLRPSA
jgi:uncharacterized protein (DUF433 family)